MTTKTIDRLTKKLLTLSVISLMQFATPTSYAAESIAEAISNGDAKLNFRLRYEDVDQNLPVDKTGNALTLRSRITYTTESLSGLSAQFEIDNITAADNNSYNSTINGATTKAVIADPRGTEVNQVWLQYENWKTKFKYGRQRILLDNQRFVGGVGFRQNEQTYDAFSITNTSVSDTTLFYARVNNVNRIFGDNSAVGDHDSKTDLINAKFSGWKLGNITAYAYLIDNKDLPRFSTDTYGLRFIGKQQTNDMTFGYTLELAKQQESNNNTLKYSANYFLAEGSLGVAGVNLGLGIEQLGSDKGIASFITPLATLHGFQGWADQFLATPAAGISDRYLSAGGKVTGIKFSLVYHNLKSDVNNAAGQDDLGSEVDFVASKVFGPYGLSLTYADYNAGDVSFANSDTRKFWLTATAIF